MLERMEKVFREVFDNDEMVLEESASRDTLPDWDSFAQVKLIIGMEEEFGVKFTTEEVLESYSVKALQQLLHNKGVTQ